VEAKVGKIPSLGELVPAGEEELMGKHAADLAKVAYVPGKGLSVSSEDGKFGLITRLRAQVLATYQDAEATPPELGTILRRARLQFIGNAFGKHNKFKAELAVSPRDLRVTESGTNTILRESPLLTWFLEFDHLKDLTLRVGQYKIPFSRQRVISSGNQQMVDRSIANGEFTLDRDIGFDIRSKNLLGLNLFRYYLGIYNGEGRSAYSNGTKHLMYLGRVEVLPFGIFKDYSEGDHQRLAKPGLSIGLAYAFANNAEGVRVNQGAPPADGGTADFHNIAADVTFKYRGLSLSSEFFWRDGDPKPGDAVDEEGMPIPPQLSRQGIGWFAQAGYLLPRQPLEFAGRYGRVQAEGTSALTDHNEAGAAASYYFAQHAFKLQSDFFRVWEDSSFEEGEWRFRLQVQLAL